MGSQSESLKMKVYGKPNGKIGGSAFQMWQECQPPNERQHTQPLNDYTLLSKPQLGSPPTNLSHKWEVKT